MGLWIAYQKHCHACWGSYVEMSEDEDVMNMMQDRTAPCISFGPAGNIQGSIKCYNIEIKQIAKRHTITPLPMPDQIIHTVIKMGKRAKQICVKD